MTNTNELHVAVAKECNSATTDPNNATPNATPVQQGRLKCLANKVLERNAQRNNNATIAQSECNNFPLNTTEKLHPVSQPERWNPELAVENYVWCFDCKFWDRKACSHPNNPFRKQCVQVPRKCHWYAAKM